MRLFARLLVPVTALLLTACSGLPAPEQPDLVVDALEDPAAGAVVLEASFRPDRTKPPARRGSSGR